MPSACYAASVVLPMRGPPVRDGAVLVEDGRVIAVGAAEELAHRAERVERWAGVLLPGLVDGRARVEHADVAVPPAGSHLAWADGVAGAVAAWDDAAVAASARRGVAALLRAGVTCVGDVVGRGPGVPAACQAGLAGDSYVEIDDVDVAHHDEVVAALERSLALPAPGRRVGVTVPHTAAVGTGVLQALVALAGRVGAPLHVPGAVTREELVAVRSGEGPLAARAAARRRGFEWLEGGTGLMPLAYLAACGGLEVDVRVAHATWAGDAELAELGRRAVGVVLAPRAVAALSTGTLPLTRLVGAGVPLALGSESPAVDAPDVLAEAAALADLAEREGPARLPSPEGPLPPAEAALRLATVDGARAMGWGDLAGVLAPGRRADLVVVDVAADADAAAAAVVRQGAGRQVLTVVGGEVRARRSGPDAPWEEPAEAG